MGGTAMHAAAFFGRGQIAQILIDRGADVTIENNFGSRPIAELMIDWQTTRLVADSMHIDLDESALAAGRQDVLSLVAKRLAPVNRIVTKMDSFSDLLASPAGRMLPKLLLAMIVCGCLAGTCIAIRWQRLNLG